MISINRGDCPERLAGGSSAQGRYAHREVVDALHSMQHGKCCYCELEISGEGHGKAVEHFAPKAVFKGQRNDWENLLLACAQCNGKKSDDFPVEMLTAELDEPKVAYVTNPESGTPLVINPSDQSIDPEAHLDFVLDDKDDSDHGLIYAKANNKSKANSKIGRYTIKVLGLDRAYYTKKHGDHLIELGKDYLLLLTAKRRGDDKEVKRWESEFRMSVSAKRPLAAVARAFAHDKKLDKRFNIPIPKGAAT